MYSGYWDDYCDVAEKKKKETLLRKYRVCKDGKLLYIGYKAHKIAAKKLLGAKDNYCRALIENGYTVHVKIYNVSKRVVHKNWHILQ